MSDLVPDALAKQGSCQRHRLELDELGQRNSLTIKERSLALLEVLLGIVSSVSQRAARSLAIKYEPVRNQRAGIA